MVCWQPPVVNRFGLFDERMFKAWRKNANAVGLVGDVGFEMGLLNDRGSVQKTFLYIGSTKTGGRMEIPVVLRGSRSCSS